MWMRSKQLKTNWISLLTNDDIMRVLLLFFTLSSSCLCLGQGLLDFAKIESDVDSMLVYLHRTISFDEQDGIIAATPNLCEWLSKHYAVSHPPKKKRCWVRKIRIEAEASLMDDLQHLCFLFNLNNSNVTYQQPATLDIQVPDGGSQGDSILGFKSFLQFQRKKLEYETKVDKSLVKLLVAEREARFRGVMGFLLKEIKVKLTLYRLKKYRLLLAK